MNRTLPQRILCISCHLDTIQEKVDNRQGWRRFAMMAYHHAFTVRETVDDSSYPDSRASGFTEEDARRYSAAVMLTVALEALGEADTPESVTYWHSESRRFLGLLNEYL